MTKKELYEFGEFRLDVAERFLARLSGGKRVPLSEKAFETLCVLVRNGGHLVSKDELMNQVWADSFVEENNLDKSIYAIRRALGEKPGEQKFIETVRKYGYRFVGEVRRVYSEETADIVHKENGFQAKIKQNSPAEFPRLPEQVETPRSGAVVALADWRRESDRTGTAKQVSPKPAPEELTESTIEPESSPAKPNIESRHVAKYRLPLIAFAAAAILIGAIALGYYFYGGKKASYSADGKKTIAVLPLKPINTANREDIYEIGIAESLINNLNSMKGFVARPLSATRKYADIEQDAITAGKEQQVDYVLASNYQLAGGKIKVTAELFNVASGQIEETYKIEKDAGDLFAMQDAIAGEVGNKLLARFATSSSNLTAKRGTTNEEAYRLYLQGRNLTDTRNVADSRKAVEYFEQAIRLDPNFARTYSGMAKSFLALGSFGGGLPRVEYEKAKIAVTKALELDNNFADGYTVSGEVKLLYEWNFAEAEKDLLRAIEIEPNSALAHEQYGSYLATRGRFDEAIAEIKTALEIDPNSIQYQGALGRILYLARRFDESIIQLKQTIEIHKDVGAVWGFLWLACEMKGDDAGAYEWFMKNLKLRNPELTELYQNAYETSGWQGVRRKWLELAKQNEQKPAANLYAMARQCALLGEKEQAFEYLNKAIEKHHGSLTMLNVEPSFDSLRDDPRFDELVRRVGLK